jgi:DNA-binding transcriptional regulator YdaS (Cro superfamily)
MSSPLAAYLDATNTSSAAFAAQLGVDQTAVMRWRKGERHPRTAIAFKIESLTAGKVTAKALAEYATSQRRRLVRRLARRSSKQLPKTS